jgi:DNA-binding NarL/FixJ family response regulator
MVVDDHVTLRRGLELLLDRCGCSPIDGASSATEARAQVLAEKPDVVVLDMRLGEESGVELTRRLHERVPEVAVLLYTGLTDPTLLKAGLDSGARGLVLKSATPERLIAAVLTLADGGRYTDPAALEILERTPASELLSPRERDVLRLFARGRTGSEVAEDLSVSPETVRTQVRNARRKLGAQTRTHAVVAALEASEIEL